MPGLFGIIAKTEASAKVAEQMLGPLQHEADYRIERFSHPPEFVVGNILLALPDQPDCHYSNEATGAFCLLDGELYNAPQLRRALPQQSFGTPGDAEIILRLYEAVGEEFLRDLNGRFNLLIYDHPAKKILLATDRFGIRPLYFFHSAETFLFAPEVKAVAAAPGMAKDLDHASVCEHFLLGAVLENKTLLRQVSRVPPATKWVFALESRRWRQERYWDWDEYSKLPRLSPGQFLEQGLATLQAVIPRYFRDPHRVTFALTGGVDTRVIAAALSQSQEILPRQTFTHGYHRMTADNRLAARISNRLGIPHQFILRETESLTLAYLDHAVSRCDGQANFGIFSYPFFMSPAYRAIHKNNIVVTGGYGSQIFGRMTNPPLVAGLKRQARRAVVLAPKTWEMFVMPKLSLEPGAGFLRMTIEQEVRGYWYWPSALRSSLGRIRTPYLDNDLIALLCQLPGGGSNSNQLQQCFVRSVSPALARLPTNRGLVFARGSFPDALLAGRYWLMFQLGFEGGGDRRLQRFLPLRGFPILRKRLRMPDRVMQAMEFNPEVRQLVLEKKTLDRGLFRPEIVTKLVEEHYAGQANWRHEIAQICILELFLRRVVD